MRVTAIVLAAGTGDRMQHRIKKPYISLLGQPILVHTLRVLSGVPAIQDIIVTVYPGEERRCEKEIIQTLHARTGITVVAGGERRQDSVRNALTHAPETSALVLIHDGARPLITQPLIERAIRAAQKKKAVSLAVPVKDTITMVSKEDMLITRVLPRDSLYIIQTPQVFTKEIILEAHRKAFAEGFQGTDDASLVEHFGRPVTVIMGSYENIKITTQEDLLLAAALMKGRQQ
ncbi:MAG: 2-C-methyl-D-erythritol 4-phosphate cytidylyltransferase [Pseudomonadota bacterium]